MIRQCLFCEKQFNINSSQQKFCCVEHKKEYNKKNKKVQNNGKREFTKICKTCHTEFLANVSNRKECNFCRGRRSCEFCGKEFQDIKNKRRKTCSIECDKKLRNLRTIETSLKKYGTEYPNQSKIVKDKIQNSFDKTWGGHPSKSKELLEKRRKTCKERYGVEFTLQLKEIRDRSTKTKREKYGEHMELIVEKSKETLLKTMGIPYGIFSHNNSVLHSISKENIRISNLLRDKGLENEYEFRLGRYSYDLHILDTNILIEINPTYTHNSTFGYIIKGKTKKPKDKYYHYNKSKNALKSNYICIHKFDWTSDSELLNIISDIKNNTIRQESPQLHWYNRKSKEHLLNNNFNREDMINSGFVEIYDDGTN